LGVVIVSCIPSSGRRSLRLAERLVDRQRGDVHLARDAVHRELERASPVEDDGVAVADRVPGSREEDIVRSGLEALVVQHVADRVGVGADMANLSVDGERHGLLGDEEGQRAADEAQQDHGEQTELERAAHEHFHRVREPGQENWRAVRRRRTGHWAGSDGNPARS
jgi:hypothetical protein